MKSEKVFFTAFLVGLTIGGIIGLLAAPDLGKNSRAKLKKTGKNLCDGSKDLGENLGSLTAALRDNMNPYRDQMEMKVREIEEGR